MCQLIRSRNLGLIRHLNGGHNNAASKLASVTNSNYLSKMIAGEMDISDYKARIIEGTLQLPAGWMDRDNFLLLDMSPVQSEIFSCITKLSTERQAALLSFLSTD